MERQLQGRPVMSGSAEGLALVAREPLSFWGGYSPETGEIIDRRHERSGAQAAGRVLLIPHERGSSTSSAILLESIRRGVAPAAIISTRTPPVLALGSIVADELYGRSMPIVVVSEEDFLSIEENDRLRVRPDGTIVVG